MQPQAGLASCGFGSAPLGGADGSYRVLVKDPLLSWPDGLRYGSDGYFYVTVNQLHRHAVLNQGQAAGLLTCAGLFV